MNRGKADDDLLDFIVAFLCAALGLMGLLLLAAWVMA